MGMTFSRRSRPFTRMLLSIDDNRNGEVMTNGTQAFREVRGDFFGGAC